MPAQERPNAWPGQVLVRKPLMEGDIIGYLPVADELGGILLSFAYVMTVIFFKVDGIVVVYFFWSGPGFEFEDRALICILANAKWCR